MAEMATKMGTEPEGSENACVKAIRQGKGERARRGEGGREGGSEGYRESRNDCDLVSELEFISANVNGVGYQENCRHARQDRREHCKEC